MSTKFKLLLLAMLVFTCSARLLTEGDAPAEEKPADAPADAPAEEKLAEAAPAEEKPAEAAAAEAKPAEEHKPEGEAKPADAHHDGPHKDEGKAPHKAGDKPAEPRGKRFYILMAVSVLMIGAVCSAFILGKKKE